MPQSMEFSSLEYWNRLPFPPPGYLLDPGIKLLPLTSPALASKFFTIRTTWEVSYYQHLLGNYKSCSHEPQSVPNKLESLRLGFCCLCSTSHPGDSKEHWNLRTPALDNLLTVAGHAVITGWKVYYFFCCGKTNYKFSNLKLQTFLNLLVSVVQKFRHASLGPLQGCNHCPSGYICFWILGFSPQSCSCCSLQL